MYDVIVIGAGPSGASTALFTAKAGKNTLIIDNDKSITKKAWIENHYGVPEVTGPDLLETGKQQAIKFGAKITEAQVNNIEKAEHGLTVITDNENFQAKHVVIATGMLTNVATEAGIATKEGTEPRVKTIIDVDAQGKTSLDGVWAAGTCAGCSVHTIITAGDGARVAINLISELNGERYVDHDILK